MGTRGARLAPGVVLGVLALGGCASYPQLVMLNRMTGDTVKCRVPDITAGPKDFLVSRACLSACEAHGFRVVPGMPAAPAEADIPQVCSD